jgi:hypothetical protein
LTELAPLTWDLIWLAAPAILLAGLVHGTFGIGFPMIATPLLALFTDVFSAVLICVIPTMSVNLMTIWHGGREQLKNIRPHLVIIPFTLLVGRSVNSVTLSRTTSAIGKACERRTSRR